MTASCNCGSRQGGVRQPSTCAFNGNSPGLREPAHKSTTSRGNAGVKKRRSRSNFGSQLSSVLFFIRRSSFMTSTYERSMRQLSLRKVCIQLVFSMKRYQQECQQNTLTLCDRGGLRSHCGGCDAQEYDNSEHSK
ncbi:hypothetical protein RR46_10399 [Papilio xuthus]|uniref:Uncharacterized protein n=1 Tax=Papilio xuthus TaxID=66420 RepID=A0A194Q0K0_PAPXU|nr:hypothetical protein RR46_10399 [Papilio xuthus]